MGTRSSKLGFGVLRWPHLPVDSAATSQTETTQAETLANQAAVCRHGDGYLWVVVPQGVHTIQVQGSLADTNEWVLAFPLLPKRVTVEAPQWQVVGLRSSGVPESQLFFTRSEKAGEDRAKYDQRIYRPVVMVERRLEIGLIWKIHNKVTRLSTLGKAIALKIPLLMGERVISSTTDPSSGGEGAVGEPRDVYCRQRLDKSLPKLVRTNAQLELPRPEIVSISIWYYRLAMLLWALWLASALLRWLQTAWLSFSYGGRWLRKSPRLKV